MAKTKSTLKQAKMTGKAKSTPEPAVPLRSSPRKATQSANKIEAADAPKLSKITKKSSPSKETSASNKASLLKKASALVKKTKKATTPFVAPDDSTSTKKSTTPCTMASASASPKPRGRPRKDGNAGPPTTKVQPDKDTVAILSPRNKKPDASVEVLAPVKKSDWTDSPKKKSSAKGGSRSTILSGNSSTKDIVDHLEGALGGMDLMILVYLGSVEEDHEGLRELSPEMALGEPGLAVLQVQNEFVSKGKPTTCHRLLYDRWRMVWETCTGEDLNAVLRSKRKYNQALKRINEGDFTLYPGVSQTAKGDTTTRQASFGGIKKSIEAPSPTRALRSKPQSPSRKAANNPIRIATSSPTKTRGRSASIGSVGRPRTSRSKSPVKPVVRSLAKTSDASPSRKASNTSLGSHPKSPVKAISRKASSMRSLRTPSRSPDLDTVNASVMVEKTISSRTPNVSSTYARPGSPMRPQSPIRTRGRSPAKPSSESGSKRNFDKSSEHSKSRSKSPKNVSGTTTPRRCSREPVKPPDRNRSRSPRKLAPAQAASAGQAAFNQKYAAEDNYGGALRTTESKAYKAQKAGQVIEDRDQALSDVDADRARARGVERAEQESAIRLFDNREQRVRDGYHQRILRLPSANRSRSRDRHWSSSLHDQYKDEAERHLPDKFATDDGDEDELAETHASPSAGQSPIKRKAYNDRGSLKRTSKAQSPPSRRSSRRKDDNAPLPPGQPSAPKRGPIHSTTNPELIPGTVGRRKNPFFETMPAPEVWHRRMPAYFSFGETPLMEREMSRQISEDLARGKEEGAVKSRQSSSLIGRTMSAVSSGVSSGVSTMGNAFGFGKTPASEWSHKSPWDLPEVTDADIEEGFQSIGKMERSETKTYQKRKASDPASGRFPKQARRRSSGDIEYFMSGALR